MSVCPCCIQEGPGCIVNYAYQETQAIHDSTGMSPSSPNVTSPPYGISREFTGERAKPKGLRY
jgi:hypothetical protein